MKKKQIGFMNTNDQKVKAVDDSENKDQHEEAEHVPAHIVNEIEEHVLAKQEYENSMHTLYLFKTSLKVIGIVIAIIAIGCVFYLGYMYGCNVTLKEYQKHQDLTKKLNIIYNIGYDHGVKSVSDKSVQVNTKQ